MVEGVGVNDVAPGGERRYRTRVGGVAAGKEQRGFGPLEHGERSLELLVELVRSGNESGGGRPRAFTRERGRYRTGDTRIAGQAQVVVRREVDGRAPVGAHSGAPAAAHRMRLAAQVRMVEHGEVAAKQSIERRGRLCDRTSWHGAETTRADDARSSACGVPVLLLSEWPGRGSLMACIYVHEDADTAGHNGQSTDKIKALVLAVSCPLCRALSASS